LTVSDSVTKLPDDIRVIEQRRFAVLLYETLLKEFRA
jgi:hypothetical protein